MRALLAFACILGASLGHAADVKLYVGPDGNPALSGRYWLIVTHTDGSAPTVTLVLDTTGSGPPPPPVADLDAKIGALVALVNEPDKAKTAAKLAKSYANILSLVSGGQIATAEDLRVFAKALIDGGLKASNKTEAWSVFTSGMESLTAPLDLSGVVNAYTLAAAKLGGTAPPPPPPPPVTNAARAVILRESGSQTQPMALLLNQLRNDPAWSKLVEVLDPQQVNQDQKPDPLTASLLSQIGSRPLPRVVYLDAVGSFVGDDTIPATFDALKSALTAKGIKP